MAILVLLGIGLIALILFLLFGAMILKISCSFVDVRQPSWMKAVGIVVVSLIIQLMALFLLMPFLKDSGESFGKLVAGVVGTAVAAAVYSAMLETEYWRGLIICIIEHIIGWIIAVVLLAVFLGVLIGSGSPSRRNFNSPPGYEQPAQPEEPERPTSFEVKD